MKRLAAIAIIMLCCAQGLFAQSFVFSVRPEGIAVSGPALDSVSERQVRGTPIEKGIAVGGWAVESGLLRKSGGYYTVSVHGGLEEKENIGAFFNFGSFGGSDGFYGGMGGSLGFHRIPYHINVVKDNVNIDRYTDYNYLIGGVFFKFLFGKTHNLDITPKVVLGYRESHFVTRDAGAYRYYYDDNSSDIHNGINIAFSLGVGYTLTAGRR